MAWKLISTLASKPGPILYSEIIASKWLKESASAHLRPPSAVEKQGDLVPRLGSSVIRSSTLNSHCLEMLSLTV